MVPVGGGSFQATYNGSTTYNTDVSPCEPRQAATKLTSEANTAIHAGAGAGDTARAAAITTAAIGSTVHDKATVTGTAAGGTPTGNVSFVWFATTDCTGPSIAKGTVDLDADGVAHPSNDQVVPVGGGSFQATYNGSTTYNTDVSPCEPLTAQAPPSGHIFPTATTCNDVKNGTAMDLDFINYSLKSGKINQVDPGVFFYWIKVSGGGTYTITQSASPPFKLFNITAGTAVFNAGCSKVGSASISQNSSTGNCHGDLQRYRRLLHRHQVRQRKREG